MQLPHYSRQQNNRGPSRGGEHHPRRALCPQKAAVSWRNPPPWGSLSPNGNGFREEPLSAWHFFPNLQQFPGGNALLAPREILLSPEGVCFREEPLSAGHFVPERKQFLGETHPRGALCPQMATVSGRKCPSGAEGDTFVPRRHLFPGEMVLSSRH